MIKQLFQLITAIAGGIAIAVPSMVPANEDVMMLSKNPNNWAMWGRTYDGSRYSPLVQIDKDNVGDLQVAWTFSTGDLRGHEGGPLVIGDTVYRGLTYAEGKIFLQQADTTLVEKPLSLTREELREVAAAARSSPAFFQVGFNRRFAPLSLAAKAHLATLPGRRHILLRVNAGRRSATPLAARS